MQGNVRLPRRLVNVLLDTRRRLATDNRETKKRCVCVQVFEDPKDGPQPQAEYLLESNNVLVRTKWGSWSKCSNCGTRGYRKRTGLCVVEVRLFTIEFQWRLDSGGFKGGGRPPPPLLVAS